MSSEWNSPYLSCQSVGNCLYGHCCGPCANASARTRYDSSNWCLNCVFLSGPLTRNIIREGYGIEGNCLVDVLLSCICPGITTAQLLNEVESRGPIKGAVEMQK
eukprot:m51a1_g13370 hypothetical protein (104) ;mRNA; f:1697-2144